MRKYCDCSGETLNDFDNCGKVVAASYPSRMLEYVGAVGLLCISLHQSVTRSRLLVARRYHVRLCPHDVCDQQRTRQARNSATQPNSHITITLLIQHASNHKTSKLIKKVVCKLGTYTYVDGPLPAKISSCRLSLLPRFQSVSPAKATPHPVLAQLTLIIHNGRLWHDPEHHRHY